MVATLFKIGLDFSEQAPAPVIQEVTFWSGGKENLIRHSHCDVFSIQGR
jgi:hypothetical protein